MKRLAVLVRDAVDPLSGVRCPNALRLTLRVLELPPFPAFFILANSFFVAAEFAIVSVRETRMQQLVALNRPGARTALALKHSIDEFLPAVQFGVTLASLALGWLGEPAVAQMLLDLAARWFAQLARARRRLRARRRHRGHLLRGHHLLRGPARRARSQVARACPHRAHRPRSRRPHGRLHPHDPPGHPRDERLQHLRPAHLPRAARRRGLGALAGRAEADRHGDSSHGLAPILPGRDHPSRHRAEPRCRARDHDDAPPHLLAARGHDRRRRQRAHHRRAALPRARL